MPYTRRRRPQRKSKPAPKKIRKQVNKVVKRKNNESIFISARKNNYQIFPDILKTNTRTVVHSNYGGTISNSQSLTFKGNSYYLTGPQTDYTGSFPANVPAGLVYLLSQNSPTGSVAPYNKYRIKSSKIVINVATNQNAVSIPVYLLIIPSRNASLSGMTLANLMEQPYCKRVLLPSSMTYPKTISHAMSSLKMFGDQYKSQIEDKEYEGSSTADPTNTWYWHVLIRSANGTTNIDGYINSTLYCAVDFIERNNYESTTPS